MEGGLHRNAGSFGDQFLLFRRLPYDRSLPNRTSPRHRMMCEMIRPMLKSWLDDNLSASLQHWRSRRDSDATTATGRRFSSARKRFSELASASIGAGSSFPTVDSLSAPAASPDSARGSGARRTTPAEIFPATSNSLSLVRKLFAVVGSLENLANSKFQKWSARSSCQLSKSVSGRGGKVFAKFGMLAGVIGPSPKSMARAELG